MWRQSSLWQGAQGPSPEESGVTSGKEIITETESFPIRQLLTQPPPFPLSSKQPGKGLALKTHLDQQILAGV